MTSSDYGQVTTIIHRLGLLAQLLNPLTVMEVLIELPRILAVPPPGDPAELLFLGDSFATAGNDIAPLVADVRTIAASNLPEIWKGDGGAAAARVVSATADLMSTAQPAFAKAANALTDYAGKVRRLRAEHGRLRDELSHLSVTDPVGSLATITEVIAGCQSVYQRSLDAADEVRGRLADVAGAARAAAAWQGGTRPDQAVVLADTWVGLSPSDRARLDALLAQASTDEERAHLLKAFAAGHSVDELVAFDAQIHGRPT